MARFGEMMLYDGYYNGQQINPEHIIRDIKKGGNRKYLAESKHSHLSGFSYHNQWWVSHDQFGGYSAKAEIVIVKLSSHLPRAKETIAFQTIIKYLLKQ